MTARSAQVTLSVEEIDAIREDARSEARLSVVRAPAPEVGFSVEDVAAIRDEYEARLRMLELELKAARAAGEQARSAEIDARRAVEEILRSAYNLEQVLSRRLG